MKDFTNTILVDFLTKAEIDYCKKFININKPIGELTVSELYRVGWRWVSEAACHKNGFTCAAAIDELVTRNFEK